ncbi:MAG: 30S ribosomal protein S8 [Verrucomicrobia bacterium]|nr:30S ribosomal protein S8 [Verrucomicrobiota bacterium]MDA1085733.1 30S ribosomal protein S8 [Verrucomicrobiota bacterium]
MSMSDPIADLLTRIRNAHIARLDSLEVRYSKLKADIVELMKREGFVTDVEVIHEGPKRELSIRLKYYGEKEPAIRGLKRISRPGLRNYVKATNVPRVLDGLGVAVLSTSSGILTDRQARRKNVGGEVLCHLW